MMLIRGFGACSLRSGVAAAGKTTVPPGFVEVWREYGLWKTVLITLKARQSN